MRRILVIRKTEVVEFTFPGAWNLYFILVRDPYSQWWRCLVCVESIDGVAYGYEGEETTPELAYIEALVQLGVKEDPRFRSSKGDK